MGTVCQIAAVCLLAAVLAGLIRKESPGLALLLAAAVAVAAIWAIADALLDIVSFLKRLAGATGLASEIFLPLVKTVGIALVSRIGSGLCRDAGEGTLAAVVELAAAFGAIWVSLPLLEAVWEMLLKWL